MMRILDQNNKYGIWDSGLLVEGDVSGHVQWYSADSDLDFYSTIGVKDPLFITSTHSDTVSPKSSPFHPF